MTQFRDIHGLINHFWQMRLSTFFTSLEADLYYALLHEANTRKWEENFSISNGWLTAKIGTSEPSLIRARNKLKQCGLIDFVSGKTKRQPSKYTILYAKNHLNNFSSNNSENTNYLNNFSSNVSQSVSSNVSQSVRHVKKEEIRNKNINTNTPLPPQGETDFFEKENLEEDFSTAENFEEVGNSENHSGLNAEIPSPKKVAPKKGSPTGGDEPKQAIPKPNKRKSKQDEWDSEIDQMPLPHDSDSFRTNWQRWRENRKLLKKPITPIAAKTQLELLGQHTEKEANDALVASITNGWQGLFPKKETATSPTSNAYTQKTPRTYLDFNNADYSRKTFD